MLENKINTLLVLGDIYDTRENINVLIQTKVLELFGKTLKDFNIIIILGNHDSFFNDSNSSNSLKPLALLPNVKVYEEKELIEIENKKILLVPWVIDINSFSNELEESIDKYDIIFGHLSTIGFNMGGGIASDGINPKLFLSKAKKTFLGHFHSRSKKTIAGNTIQYIGAPYELTKIDENEPKGAMILDLNTLNYFFINNTVSIKHKTFIYPQIPLEEEVYNNKITVFMTSEENLDGNKVDKYIKNIEEYKPAYDIKIELFQNKIEIKNFSEISNITIDKMFKQYLDSSEEYKNNKEELYNLLIKEYNKIKNN